MIIITGASRGIGQYLFNEYINKQDPNSVLGIYNSTKPKINNEHACQVDISNPEQVIQFVNSKRDVLKDIVLINCAGINYNTFAHKADPYKWAKIIGVNLIGTFNMINALLPIMREQNYGRIINFASVIAQKGVSGTSAYAASKSGLWGMSKAIAIENAIKGITINNLNLGYFKIGMIQEIPIELLEKTIVNIPMKRLGDPKEILSIVNHLIINSYITGTSIDINGGLV